MDPNVKDFNQHFLLSALLSYSNKNIYFSQTTSPGPTPVNALLFWSAHTLLPVSWCFRWRQRGSDCEAGGGSVCWVYELADVLLVWMSWKHTHVHTHTWSDNSSAGETITGNGGTVSFISSSRFLPPFHLYDFVKTKGKHTLARKKIERKLYKKLSAYVVILIMGRGKFRDRCTTFVTV